MLTFLWHKIKLCCLVKIFIYFCCCCCFDYHFVNKDDHKLSSVALTAVRINNVFNLPAKVCKEKDAERRFAGKLFHT